MNTKRGMALLGALFCAGMFCGVIAARKTIDPTTYVGKAPAEAGALLAQHARTLAGNGSWERLAVARVLYLGGRKDEGQALIDSVRQGKLESSDLARIARIYLEAGEQERGLKTFEEALAREPGDADLRAEFGAYLNLAGQRERAEQVIGQALEKDGGDVYNVAAVAGSYLGVPPRKL
jgi:Flp pilus assembly protein TadD